MLAKQQRTPQTRRRRSDLRLIAQRPRPRGMPQLSYRDRNANEVILHPQTDIRTLRVLTMGTNMVDSIQTCTRGSKVHSMGTTHLLTCMVLKVDSMDTRNLLARTIMDIELLVISIT